MKDGVQFILIKVLPCGHQLELDKEGISLFSNFCSCGDRMIVLTNGVEYWFYAKSGKGVGEESGRGYFFSLDMSNLNEGGIRFLSNLACGCANIGNLLTVAGEINLANSSKEFFIDFVKNLPNDFIRAVMRKNNVPQAVSHKAIDMHRHLIQEGVVGAIMELASEIEDEREKGIDIILDNDSEFEV